MPLPDRMSAEEFRRLMSSGKAGSAWKGRVARPTEEEGIVFPSKIQAEAFRRIRKGLCYPDGKPGTPPVLVIREPRFDLRSLANGKKPGSWKPDFLAWFDSGVVCVYEAKGSKAAESRDWRLRARAFRYEFPQIPVFVYRYNSKKQVEMFALEEA